MKDRILYHLRCIAATSLPFLLALLAALAVVSCDVHEFPSEESPAPPEPPKVTGKFNLHVRFTTDLPVFKEVYYDNGQFVDAASYAASRAVSHDTRYIINVYPAVRSGEYSRASELTFVRTLPEEHGLDADFELDMPQGDYRIMVWTDYVDAGSEAGKYYDASDFNEIIIADREGYNGSHEYRDAFRGFTDVTIDYGPGYDPSRADEVTVEATVPMERPLAKYRFISTDLDTFVEQEESRARGGRAASASEPSRSPDLDDYMVRMRYAQYMPCSFNMFTNRPADSWTGMSYTSSIKRIDDREAELAFDYVLVNGVESAVAVSLEVLHKDGTLIASMPAINVPLKRSLLTEVRGEFLTTKAGGAVGIDPGYNGPDFNIFIP